MNTVTVREHGRYTNVRYPVSSRLIPRAVVFFTISIFLCVPIPAH